jgi:hypothetical protein
MVCGVGDHHDSTQLVEHFAHVLDCETLLLLDQVLADALLHFIAIGNHHVGYVLR